MSLCDDDGRVDRGEDGLHVKLGASRVEFHKPLFVDVVVVVVVVCGVELE